MALITGGTTGTTVLQGIKWLPGMSQADVAAVAALIKLQINPRKPISPGGFANTGVLDMGDRFGQINLLPGDYLFVDSNGWPIVVSSQSIAAGGTSWAHS